MWTFAISSHLICISAPISGPRCKKVVISPSGHQERPPTQSHLIHLADRIQARDFASRFPFDPLLCLPEDDHSVTTSRTLARLRTALHARQPSSLFASSSNHRPNNVLFPERMVTPTLPCALIRQDCLVGRELALAVRLPEHTMDTANSLPSRAAHSASHAHLSTFEHLFTTIHPLIETLCKHLPTSAIFDLYHTSRRWRKFLRTYPLAWRSLSFRLLPPANSTAIDNPADLAEHDLQRRACALDKLIRVLVPYNSLLARLDLDNTSVGGAELYAQVLVPRRPTLEHLSVRGCKDVSLKYHILPFLEMEASAPSDLFGNQPLALRSLYVYRCRHHRRRPYLPSSLTRRDSDSQPTHAFIEICHRLGIWTDTAWCPTPGPRCHRRRDYYVGRHGTLGDTEIWVPFDRLWRSQNTIGSVDEDSTSSGPPRESWQKRSKGRLWEDQEYGYQGEALGSGVSDAGDGKGVPAHLRKSHRTFVEGFRCDECQEDILERCEQCSVRMHCMACRKTLCASCAFDRPLKRKRRRPEAQSESDDAGTDSTFSALDAVINQGRVRTRPMHRFWWAPGATRSPNMISETSFDAESSDEEDEPESTTGQPLDEQAPIPRLDMHWCCLKPTFSGGGGIAFVGTQCGDNIKAAPLPKNRGFEDHSFSGTNARREAATACPKPCSAEGSQHSRLYQSLDKLYEEVAQSDPGAFDIVPLLEQEQDPASTAEMRLVSPRSLCTPCYRSTQWRVLCGACKIPLCIDHDIKTLKVRKCGYRMLSRERETIQAAKAHLRSGSMIPKSVRDRTVPVFYSKWRPIVQEMREADRLRLQQGRWAPLDRHVDDGNDMQSLAPSSAADLAMDHMSSADNTPSSYPEIPHLQSQSSDLLSTAGTEYADYAPPRPLHRSKSWSTLPPDPCSQLPDMASYQHLSMLPLRWHGCGQFFCPSPRAPGDPRPRCSPDNFLRPCSKCGVNACSQCVLAGWTCSCSSCASNGFMCPNCVTHPAIRRKCRGKEEALARAGMEDPAEEEKEEAPADPEEV